MKFEPKPLMLIEAGIGLQNEKNNAEHIKTVLKAENELIRKFLGVV